VTVESCHRRVAEVRAGAVGAHPQSVGGPADGIEGSDQGFVCETHVRGLTIHASSGVEYPGTYWGAVQKCQYLKELGVTAIEMMAIAPEADPARLSPGVGAGTLKSLWSSTRRPKPTSGSCASTSRTPHRKYPSLPIRPLADVRQSDSPSTISQFAARAALWFSSMPGRLPNAVGISRRCRFAAVPAISVPPGHPVGEREARAEVHSRKAGVK
jgi:hypothetical protein